MPWTRIANAKAGSLDGTTVTTGGQDTTGADLLVAVVGQEDVATCAVSDSKGNVWTKITEQIETPGKGSLWYSVPTSAGAAHTFTAAQAGSNPAICVEAWSYSRPSPLDQSTGAHSSAAGATLATGSITPTLGNELVFAGATGRNAQPTSINSSFTLGNSQATSATNDTAAIAYLNQGAPAAINPTWTFDAGASVRTAMIASFKAKAPSMLAVF